MSSAGSSPAGVGGSPSILARALPSPLSGSYSWPSPTGFSSGDDDLLFRYVANLGPGVGTSTTPPVDNAPPAGTGTPSPARSAGRQSPVRGTAVGVGTTTTSTGGLSTRNLPGRAATPPGRGYLAGRGSPRAGPSQGSPRAGPSRPTRGGKQPRRGLGGRPSRGGKQPRRGLGRGGGGGGGGGGTPPSTDEDDDESDVSTPRRRRPRRMNQEGLQRQLEILLNDQRQMANGRRIAGITTTNTITTTYKDGGRPRVTRNSTSVRS